MEVDKEDLFQRICRENEPDIRQYMNEHIDWNTDYDRYVHSFELSIIRNLLEDDHEFKEKIYANKFAKRFIDLIIRKSETDYSLVYHLKQVMKRTYNYDESVKILKKYGTNERLLEAAELCRDEWTYDGVTYEQAINWINKHFPYNKHS